MPNWHLMDNQPSPVGNNAGFLKMTELNYAFISENGKEVDKSLDWSYIDWHERKTVKGTDAETQTQCVQSEDRDTQTTNPFIMRIDLGRTPSRLKYGSLTEADGLPAQLFQFDRQAPARISTSPTLRRMRSTRISYREPNRIDEPLGEESSTPISPFSPLFRLKSPLAIHSDGESKNFEPSPGHRMSRSHRSKTLDNGALCKSKELCDVKEPDSDDNESQSEDSEQVKDPCHKRLHERRRSSVVVSLPGLDVSPGDLFVSNGVADILNKSAYSDTKKSKWPFSRRNTTKGKTGSVADIDKFLTSVRIEEWRDTDFQTYKVFLTTLTVLQRREYLLDIDSWGLFANLNELCLVSFGFLTSYLRVIKEMWSSPDSCSTQSLLDLLRKAFGESICHCLQKYCLNYSTAILYLDSLKIREDFGSFVKWCERNEQCRRLQLKDLLVVPLHRFTRYPLLLKNFVKRSCSEEEESAVQCIVSLVERAIYDLEGKVKWLDNYQKVKDLKEALVWPPVWEQDKRVHVPENLVSRRSLLHDGKLILIENTKLQEVYLFLFDEFLLITKIKRSKKKLGLQDSSVTLDLELLLQDGCTFTVLEQPIPLDRLVLKNIDQLNANASGLPNSFIIMHQNRYQQCIGVFILQAQSEQTKKSWLMEIETAVSSLLKQDAQQPRGNSSLHYTESSQI
ncbi:hypothetical protein DNTS_007053 [Danionella cerebrum]|uniref:DH domain-containing protein n=1 Tax=Danionella cerebrum TaxID=2873325 RepID=A0A553QQK8_9TELE|nr:hypothetical protein DNTS_007053 [Danionella translucida]TRY92268.1 hypothetical protein DNTS_007053 [Danionella translucida]TRY92269.1 hypothetical protein DNTS_007053 [Danionella translucida]